MSIGSEIKQEHSSSNVKFLSSLVLKEASEGARLPITYIEFICFFFSFSKACQFISVLAKRSGSQAKMRVTSRATFPFPMMRASRPVRSGLTSRKSG